MHFQNCGCKGFFKGKTLFQMLISEFFGESGLNNRVMYFKLLLKSLVGNARDDLDRSFWNQELVWQLF